MMIFNRKISGEEMSSRLWCGNVKFEIGLPLVNHIIIIYNEINKLLSFSNNALNQG